MIRSITIGLLAAIALVGCKSTDQKTDMVANEICPIGGEAVDTEVYYEYNGTKIYTCCPKCLDKVAEDPAMAMMKAYPDAAGMKEDMKKDM